MLRTAKILACVLMALVASAPALAQTTAPARTTALPEKPAACGNFIDIFKRQLSVQPYQPLLAFEPSYRAIHPESREPQELPLTITAKVSEFPLEIGNYRVSNVPFLHMVPRNGTEAHFFAPGGERCVIPAAMFNDRAFLSAWAYGVGRLAMFQGDSLDVDFTSALTWSEKGRDQSPKIQPEGAPNGGVPCQSSNIHTHGLLVPPWRGDDVDRAFGDFVLDVAVPGIDPKKKEKMDDACGADMTHGAADEQHAKMHYRITLPALEGKDPTISGTHPSGLYWFHPHPHGYSAPQVRGGTTGLITIGSLRDYAASAVTGEPGQAANIRYLMLKDAQIISTDPKAWTFSYDYGADLCEDPDEAKAPRNAKHIFAGGECSNKDVKAADDPDAKWIFTVNGVQYPHFRDVRPNEREILRIANASSNLTYNLALRKFGAAVNDDAEGSACGDGPDGTPKFHLISKDGVAIDTEAAGAKEICADRLLMMPGTRVEVVLDPSERGGDFELVTLPVVAGINADVWPGMALARIEIPPTSNFKKPPKLVVNGARPSAAIAAGKITALAKPPAIAPLAPMTMPDGMKMPMPNAPAKDMKMPDMPADKQGNAAINLPGNDPIKLQPADFKHPCMWQNDWERVVMLVKKVVPLAPPADAKPGDPPPDPNEEFGIVSGIRKKGDPTSKAFFVTRDGAYQKPFDGFGDLFDPANSAYNPAFGGQFDFGFICTSLHDDPETWVVENWTDEVHNFHIHQSKFSALSAKGIEASPYFNFPDEGALTAQIKRYFQSTSTDVYVDSVPVPPGLAAKDGDCNAKLGNEGCQPGRISIQIQFTRREQIGDFVFHCHILEHEDKGMMAVIHVAPKLVAHMR